ncbi:zinc finger, CCHC-type containing protein, partial [Tanacetum coccineum]
IKAKLDIAGNTLKGRKQLGEYQTGWKIKTGNVLDSRNQSLVYPRNMGFNESGEYKKTFISFGVGTGSMHVLQGDELMWNHRTGATLSMGTIQYREDSNEDAFPVAAMEKIYAHESLTFNDTVACEVISKWKAGLKDDMDARSEVLRSGLPKVCWLKQKEIYLVWRSSGIRVGNLSGDRDVEKNGKWSCIYAVGSQEYQMVCTRLDIASADVGMLDKFEHGLQTDAVKEAIWLKRLAIESGYKLSLVAGIATCALVKGGSQSKVPAQVVGVAYRFMESVKIRFGSSKYKDPKGALSKLLQLGTLEDYQQEFEKLMNRVIDIPDSLLISFNISGLKLNLQHELLVSRPATLGDAFSLSRIIEARLEVIEKKEQNIIEKADTTLSLPIEKVSPVVKGPLDARHVDEVSSVIEDVFYLLMRVTWKDKVNFEGMGNVTPWAAEVRRRKRVKCYVQGSGRWKRKKVIGGGSERRLPSRVNLSRRGVLLDSHLCPLCNAAMEDVQHVFFRCDVARVVLRKICHWWDLDWQEICSFSDWDAWFLSFRLSSRLKSILEGVFFLFGGGFGGFEISWSLTLRLLIVRRFLMTLFLGPFYGVLVDVIGFFLGSIG